MRKKQNQISQQVSDGRLVRGQNKVAEAVSQHFQKLFSDPFLVRARIEGITFNHLSSDMADSLERPFTEQEVLAALKILKEDKAPGPDDFPR